MDVGIGAFVAAFVGERVGAGNNGCLDGAEVWRRVGAGVIFAFGPGVGAFLGADVGALLDTTGIGCLLGAGVGERVGTAVGEGVGPGVGALLGAGSTCFVGAGV